MGREIKRVPMNFDWPIGTVFGGFLNPFYKQSIKCPQCENGYSPEAKRLTDMWYGNAPFRPEDRGSKPFQHFEPAILEMAERHVKMSPGFYGSGILATQREARRLCELFNKAWSHHLNEDDVRALIDGNRLWDFTHTWVNGKGWVDKEPKVIPTPREVNEWSLRGMGHDSCNQWICIQAECKRLGYETTCKKCNGSGEMWPSEKIKLQAERWKPTEPPTGDGWQLWETVSEGSPISPVFTTPELLARWLAESPEYTWQTDKGTTYDQWLAFIHKGSAISFVSDGRTIVTGVQAISEISK